MKDVQQTSINAYNEDVRSGRIPTQRDMILEIIKRYQPISRAEIQRKTRSVGYVDGGLVIIKETPMASVCGRVRCLIDSNLVHVSGHKPDPETGKTVQLVSYGPQPKLNGKQYELDL